ncbi:hypothetical protein D9M68_698970 [compost metagenome]
MLHFGEAAGRAALQVEQVEAVFERQHQAAALRERDRAHVAGRGPFGVLAQGLALEAAHQAGFGVYPVQRLFAVVPQRAFAQQVAAGVENVDAQAHAVLRVMLDLRSASAAAARRTRYMRYCSGQVA